MCSIPRRQSGSLSVRRPSKGVNCIGRTVSAPAACESTMHESQMIQSEPAKRRPELSVVNWNVAAPNNNPFEYWANHEDKSYNDLMSSVQDCIDNPAKFEVDIGEIFTDKMFSELKDHLAQEGVGKSDLNNVEHMWEKYIKPLKSISGFLKDTSFGEKRLISMPDRITGWIKTDDGRNLFRPSPITAFEHDMSNVSMWWGHWKEFMFQTPILLGSKKERSVFSLLDTIPRAKYPALSETEEVLSIPLQTLCLAIFDAIFTHLLCTVAPETWQPLKQSLRTALYDNKTCSCISILKRHYLKTDIIFIQEASESFASQADKHLDHLILRPAAAAADGRHSRSQISLILAKRSTFAEESAREVTDEVVKLLKARCIEPGDLCVYTIHPRRRGAGDCAAAGDGEGPLLLASFHGDSNGKATLPVLAAIESVARDRFPGHSLIFGLDANTMSAGAAAAAAAAALTPARFAAAAAERGMSTCWDGAVADFDQAWTTYNARTYIQPQLQKAVAAAGLGDRRHMQLKDWVVFSAGPGRFEMTPATGAAGAATGAAGVAERDNTGCRKFRRGVMPSRQFPSDHAIVSLSLRRQR